MKNKYLIVLVINFLWSSLAFAKEYDAKKLLLEVDKKLNPESYESYRKIINIEPDGKKKEFVLFTLKKGLDKVASIFLSPASEKGRSSLRLGENMWLFIPGIGKPIRITSLQSVIGGVFNNSDIMRVDYSAEYNPEKVEISKDTLILHLKAKTNSVSYDKLEIILDKINRDVQKINCKTHEGMLIKTLNFKSIKDFGGGIRRPSIIETVSDLHKGYKSIMIMAKIKKRVLKDEIFTLDFMPKLESLR
jgi:hypothetical protein